LSTVTTVLKGDAVTTSFGKLRTGKQGEDQSTNHRTVAQYRQTTSAWHYPLTILTVSTAISNKVDDSMSIIIVKEFSSFHCSAPFYYKQHGSFKQNDL
jgi:hypothetical protein